MAAPKEERTVEIIVNGQKANASLKEMNAAAAVLYNQFQKMSADDPGRAKIVADYQAVKGKIGEVKTELTGVSQTTGLLKQGFANAFAIFTGGGILGLVQQLFGFFSSSKDEFTASAKSSADLEATLVATKNAAGLTADEIKKIGEERAKVTLFDDDETNRASAMLLTFKNVKKGVFEEAIPAIQDLATKMGGDGPADMKGASIQLGKALNDPIKGVTALTKVGVTFNDQQREQIASMVKAGNTAGAQKLILAELNSEFGGAAEAARKAAGGTATLAMRYGEIKETVGGFVSGALTSLSQWLGRVLDNSQPIVDIFVELGAEVVSLWHEVSDLVDGLGLFGKTGDSAVSVANFLKAAITFLVAPLRLCATVTRALIEGFIEFYNKSELLRGVLGGLGALIVSVFTTIKNDAVKILGGVGDIIVGIFTLDKDKIVAGFKAALEGTADAALASGARAAQDFAKGFEANKNNQITRTISVETTENNASGGLKPGPVEAEAAPGLSEKEKKELADKLKKLQDKADQARLDSLKHWVEVERALEDARVKAITDDREREIAGINLAAKRKAQLVVGNAAEQAEQLLAINVEREEKLQALAAEYDQKAAAQRKATLEQLLAEEDAAEMEREAGFQADFENALIGQQAYDQAMFEAKQASLEAKLVMEEQYGSKTSSLYRTTFRELQKLERDKNKADVEDAKKTHEAKRQMQLLGVKTAGDVVQTTIDLLFQDEAARKKHHNIYTALSGAKLIADGIQEVASIWRYSAENPANGVTGGVAGAVVGGIQTALAVARTVYGLTKLQQFSFTKGGRTGTGEGLAVSPMGQLLEYSGMSVGGNGKLTDESGFAVAGVVHEDEYVIPSWLRKDPQVAAFENWVEAKRVRGFYEGGATSGPAASTDDVLATLGSDGASSTEVLTAILVEMRAMNRGLGDVRDWARALDVRLDVGDLQGRVEEAKQVKYENGIRA